MTELAPKYAKEAYDSLDEAYIKGNLVNGKLYAFPVNGNVFAQQVLTFNKPLLDKYNLSIDGIKSYQDAEKVLQEFHKKTQIQLLLRLDKDLRSKEISIIH